MANLRQICIEGDCSNVPDSYTKQESDNLLNAKQNILTPGQNITIANDVISAQVDTSNFYNKSQVDSLLCDQFPVGADYVTNTNVNPGTFLCGTWELVSKGLAVKTGSFPVTWNTNTVDTATLATANCVIDGTTEIIYINWQSKVAYTDTDIRIGYFDPAVLGLNAIANGRILAYSDSGNAIGMINLFTTSNGMIQFNMIDVISSNSNPGQAPANVEWGFQLVLRAPSSYMLDSACDRFYWKRVA